MSLVNIGPTPWPFVFPSESVSLANILLDAGDEVASAAIRIPRDGTIVRAHFRTNTVTTGATVDVRMETVVNGEPSGTLFGTNTNIAKVIADGDDNVWHRTDALTGSATVVAGDLVALSVVNPSVSPGTLNIAGSSNAAFSGRVGWPHCFGPTRATKINDQNPVCALEYDDGSFAIPTGSFPIYTAVTAVALNTGTNPDEAAVYFTALGKMRVIGWQAAMALAADANYRVNLYENGNNTPLLTKEYDGDAKSTTSARHVSELFDDVYTLTSGTIYRLGFVPLTANSVTMRYIEVNSSYPLLLDEVSGRSTMHYSSRNRAGTTDPDTEAWSQVANRRLLAGLIIDQVDDGAGGGDGGTVNLLRGKL